MNTKEYTVAVKFSKIHNHTFNGHILNSHKNVTTHYQQPYDNAGAVYYIMAVLFMYSGSILLMIGSFVRKTKHDTHINTYIKGLERIRKMELKQETLRIKLKMYNRR